MYTCMYILIYVHLDIYTSIYVYVNIYLIERKYADMKPPTTKNPESIKDPIKRNQTTRLFVPIFGFKITKICTTVLWAFSTIKAKKSEDLVL